MNAKHLQLQFFHVVLVEIPSQYFFFLFFVNAKKTEQIDNNGNLLRLLLAWHNVTMATCRSNGWDSYRPTGWTLKHFTKSILPSQWSFRVDGILFAHFKFFFFFWWGGGREVRGVGGLEEAWFSNAADGKVDLRNWFARFISTPALQTKKRKLFFFYIEKSVPEFFLLKFQWPWIFLWKYTQKTNMTGK